MRLCHAGAIAGLLSGLATVAPAQDTLAVRHLLWLDLSRARPFARTYDMIVQAGDSSIVIGERRVSMQAATYAGAEAWLIHETRTGAVPSAESLYVAADFRPMHWWSALGAARLAVEFVGDSVLGAAAIAGWKQNILLATRPDIVVSAPMLEALFGLLPLTETWSDSVGVLAVDAAASRVIPGELGVVAAEDVPIDSASMVSTWVVALRAEGAGALYWVDRTSGVPVRVQQQVLVHVGRILEFRLRQEPLPPG